MKNFLSFYFYFLNDIPPLKILIYKQISPYEVMIVYVYYKWIWNTYLSIKFSSKIISK